MAINLQKGQRVDLTKGNAGLSRVLVGLGWDPVETGGGLFGSLFGGGAPDIDCDASVIMLQNDRITATNDLIYFGNLRSDCSSVIHTGDNLTGEGEGDDEQIIVDLNAIPSYYNKLVFVVNIYDCVSRKQHFGMLKNAFIRIADYQTGRELIRYELSENYDGSTALLTGEIYRHGGEWKFAALGVPTSDTGLNDIVRRYN